MGKKSISNKRVQVVDRNIGAKIRARRKSLGMSQEALADRIGVTFQQVQKYENGTNRLGSSRLQDVASALGITIGWLFESIEDVPAVASPRLSREITFSKEMIELNKAFIRIKNPSIRNAVIHFVEALAE